MQPMKTNRALLTNASLNSGYLRLLRVPCSPNTLPCFDIVHKGTLCLQSTGCCASECIPKLKRNGCDLSSSQTWPGAKLHPLANNEDFCRTGIVQFTGLGNKSSTERVASIALCSRSPITSATPVLPPAGPTTCETSDDCTLPEECCPVKEVCEVPDTINPLACGETLVSMTLALCPAFVGVNGCKP